MSEITFGRLTDLLPREAWSHEALGFTPWLAKNIDQLSDAVGMTLELTGTEIAVETFAADILARNADDGTIVLVENQLETTDHTHLGQIMTYLAGLEAQTVIWIAPKFREPHLSAIRWLNENTAEGFAFFAVRLRVVRIGNSPYAPVFEVVEKPNDWERRLGVTSRHIKSENTESSIRRRAFWQSLLNGRSDLGTFGLKVGAESNKWVSSGFNDVIIGLYIASRTCGLYVRGPANTSIDALAERLLPYSEELERRLGTPMRSSDESNWLFVSKINYPLSEEERWPEITEWMAERLRLYARTFADLSGRVSQ